jgi:hypothetical protein
VAGVSLLHFSAAQVPHWKEYGEIAAFEEGPSHRRPFACK